jgi:hypothetical protein
MRRIPIEPNPPLGENKGLRGGDRGGSHGRPLEICDDTVTVGAEGADWDREEYTAENGEKRIRMTRRK